jgi:dihydroflavonol-4-reductase
MNTILITGGTGFLGSNLAVTLRAQGHRVRVLRRQHSDLRAIGDADVEHVIGDVRDRVSLAHAIRGCDTVFHTAAVVSFWKQRRPELMEVNVGGTQNVVDVCLELGVEKLVHTSSIAAIGFAGEGRLADETHAFNWQSYDIGYRNSKHAAEQVVKDAIARGLPAVIVNPSVILGPRDVHFHAGQLIRDVYKKRVFYYLTGGINVVDVADVVAGHIAAARVGRVGERYILAGDNMTHREVLSIVAEEVGGTKPLFKLPMPVVHAIGATSEAIGTMLGREPWIPKELVAGIDRHCWYSSEKAGRELGYAITPFRDSVRRTFAWYRSVGLL